MGKRTDTKLETEQKLRPGYKKCPHCGGVIPARSTICPIETCGKEIDKKTSPKPKKPGSPLESVRETISLVKDQGDISKTRDLVERLKKIGSLDTILTNLDLIEELKGLE